MIDFTLFGRQRKLRASLSVAGLDEDVLSLSLSNLLYMKNSYNYKKFQ